METYSKQLKFKNIPLEQFKEECKKIHNAIHKGGSAVIIESQVYLVEKAPNGCRRVLFNHINFMEQNKSKNSPYAARARAGEHITWGVNSGKWILITDKEVKI